MRMICMQNIEQKKKEVIARKTVRRGKNRLFLNKLNDKYFTNL